MNDQPKESVFMLEPTHMDLNYQRFQLTALTTETTENNENNEERSNA